MFVPVALFEDNVVDLRFVVFPEVNKNTLLHIREPHLIRTRKGNEEREKIKEVRGEKKEEREKTKGTEKEGKQERKRKEKKRKEKKLVQLLFRVSQDPSPCSPLFSKPFRTRLTSFPHLGIF